MRKLTAVIASLTALGVFGVMSAGTALAANPDQGTCIGTAGFDSTGTWFFHPINPTLQTPLLGYSPESCAHLAGKAFPLSTGGLPLLASSIPVPPIPTLCTGAGVDAIECDVFAVADPLISELFTISPGGANLVFDAAFGALSASFTDIELQGTGNLSCGNGTLSGTGSAFLGNSYSLNWTAKFQNGVAAIHGTATSGTATTKLNGFIYEGDGGTLNGFGVCNNDNTPSPALVYIVT
jgi:hypothetical protein